MDITSRTSVMDTPPHSEATAFTATLDTIPWMQPQGDPDPAWRMFATRAEAEAEVRRLTTPTNPKYSDTGYQANGLYHRIKHSTYIAVYLNLEKGWCRNNSMAAAMAAAESLGLDSAQRSDVLLMAAVLSVGDRRGPHWREYMEARMDVWRRGYGCHGEVNGTLYVYRPEVAS